MVGKTGKARKALVSKGANRPSNSHQTFIRTSENVNYKTYAVRNFIRV